MPHPRYSSHEIAERGRKLYDEQLCAKVTEGNIGKFLVIGIETGEYEIAQEELTALKLAKAKHPDASLYMVRIGSRMAYQLGGAGLEPRS